MTRNSKSIFIDDDISQLSESRRPGAPGAQPPRTASCSPPGPAPPVLPSLLCSQGTFGGVFTPGAPLLQHPGLSAQLPPRTLSLHALGPHRLASPRRCVTPPPLSCGHIAFYFSLMVSTRTQILRPPSRKEEKRQSKPQATALPGYRSHVIFCCPPLTANSHFSVTSSCLISSRPIHSGSSDPYRSQWFNTPSPERTHRLKCGGDSPPASHLVCEQHPTG